MRSLHCTSFVFALLTLLTTQAHAEPASDDASFEARAGALIQQFKGNLKNHLQKAMQAGGPTHAIAVCSKKAPEITAAMSTKTLRIRRVGTRVRNKETNVPSAEISKVLAKLTPQEPAVSTTINGRKTFVRGIYLNNAVCLTCHGDKSQMSEELRTTLHTLYPNDEATGFKMGELRGAFVVQQSTP